MKIETTIFQEMMSRAVKGASGNKLIPLTSLISIELKNKVLSLITTDSTNYLYIKQGNVEGDDMRVVVEVDKLAKLVSKTTSEFVSLVLKDSYLEVTGNGKHKIELPLDENGDPIIYPDPYSGQIFHTEYVVNHGVVHKILEGVKPALAVTMESPVYTGYYVGDSVLATNREIIANYDSKIIDTPKLISAEMMNLLDVMSQDKFVMKIEEDIIAFESDDCIIYGKEQEGIEEFQIDAIKSFLDIEFASMCRVNRNQLLQVLDRLSLFVTPYDNDAVKVIMSDNSITLKSLKDTSLEELKFEDSKNSKPFEFYITIDYFVSQLKAQDNEMAEIWYGLDNVIKMVDGKLTQFVALYTPESEM